MKKVLFATTALVASAGIASAQGVELSGSAEMGIVGGSRYGDEIQFHSDIDVKFTLSGETDNGLTFGATIDLDEVNAPIGETGNPASVFLSGNFGTITMGDTDGAFDWALQELDVIGDINDSVTSHVGFNGNGGLDGSYDGQVARYDYSFGDFAFAVSAEIDDFGIGDPVFGVGGRYSGDLGGVTLGVGIGYQTTDTNGGLPGGDAEAIGISLDASFNNGIRAIFNYSDFEGVIGCAAPFNDPGLVCVPAEIDNHMGVGLFYSMDALSVGVNYGRHEIGTFAGIADYEGFGLAANYDLGGGAVVAFGYSTGSSQDFFGALGDTVDRDSFSLGVSMSF